ncbi:MULTISPECIES: rhodanese-like domain-containing protein [Paenibacillus]|uniref:Sulfurtransferase n=2 Tax=Paenibacillus TaxID=44249 RepID=A0A089LVG6_9BACL|nr:MULTISPECIES: rhodanese-like domain-containing protein [Paenibacillus]AIQ64130.1 sulfurtransferase [Paenibacillus stellifer]MDF9839575.1 rhodanese-related sulfurtransferase [Paenibacillus sp. PastF-2]MDF9846156.1 rhodanese-related sulfurtransferase [Paenibacillus sp. PastM-2]MDF9852728.1 rhodanese-related sulfurtransferase [Paenibacillus sp. PastF-1]MDH6373158.1 rhodanese-related sulfurtransferase [Paenibacillus sp. PastF-3]
MAFQIPKAVTPQEVAEQIQKGKSLNVLDVRELAEWVEGHVEGAKHIPLGQLIERHKELDRGQEFIIMCRSGNRSGLACELLYEKGYKVVNMTGGLTVWNSVLVRD